jgi:hypothetical protein
MEDVTYSRSLAVAAEKLAFKQARTNMETVTYIRRPGNHLDKQIRSGKFSGASIQDAKAATPQGKDEAAAALAMRQKLACVFLSMSVRAQRPWSAQYAPKHT